MKKPFSNISIFIILSFIFHIFAGIYLVIYDQSYDVRKQQTAELKEQEELAKEEKELKADLEEILKEIVEEKDEKKKEELIEELKEKVWEELEDKKEELLADKKELEEEKYLEELAKETLEALEKIEEKKLEEEKKKELIDELVQKDLPAIDKKIEEELKNKTVEELEQEAIKEALKDLKKIAEEEIKPVLEKTNDGVLKKIEDLIKQLADTTKKEDQKSLQEEMKQILAKTDEIINKSEETDKKFEEASEVFKKDQLETALEVFKEKEQAVEEKKEAVLEAYRKLAETEKTDKPNSNELKLPETKKDWEKLIKETNEAAKNEDNKKPENQTVLSKPLEELAQKDAEKDKAEKNLKNILKEEISEAKKASEEVKQLTTSEESKKQIKAIEKELDKAEEKSKSSQANEFKNAAETVQDIKDALPEIVKGTFKAAEENIQKDKLDLALDSLKEKEKAVEKKKEEVLDVIKKLAVEDKNNENKDNPNPIKPPTTEKEWDKLIKQSTETAKNVDGKKTENQTPLTKPLEALAKKESEKEIAKDNLKTVLKDEIKEAKKASDDFAKSAKSEETKKQISDVKKDIESAENKNASAETKEVKEAAETIQKVKDQLPELAKDAVKKEGVNNAKDPLVKALDKFKEKEQAVEKKKEEVLDALKKMADENKSKNAETASKENTASIKPPENEKEWDKLINQSKETGKNNDSKKPEPQTPLTKPLESLVQKDAEKDKAEEELKKVLKDEIGAAKKASAEVAQVTKSEEVKKQINEVKKKIDTAESKSTSTEPKEFKESAETIEAVKKAIPEIAKAEKKNVPNESKERPKDDNPNKAVASEKPKNNKDAGDLKIDLGTAKELVEKVLEQLSDLKPFSDAPESNPTEGIEKQLSKADLALKDLLLPKSAGAEQPATPEQLKTPKENLNKAHNSVEELKVEIANKEKKVKKEIETLKKNLTEKEKKEFKEDIAELDAKEKSIGQEKTLELKIEAVADAEAQADEIKSNVNENRKKSLAKNQEQREKIKSLADEIAKGLEGNDSKKSKAELVQEIENQAMETLTEEKAESFEKFLDENENNNVSKEVEEFKSEAKDSIENAIKDMSASKEGEKSSDEKASDSTANDEESESEESAEEGDEPGSEEDAEKSKSKGKGKGAKGKGKGKAGKPDSSSEEENSALAKALAGKMMAPSKDGKGDKEGQGEGKEDQEKRNSKGENGSGQKLDGNSKSAIEIANNILFRSSKTFKKATVTAEEEKRIFTENINYEGIRVPPVIKFAKPTSNGLPIEVREPSAEAFIGADTVKAKLKETPKNPERPRIKHEKFTKGNFTQIPYLRNKPTIDGKKDDWQMDKAWMKTDKQIAMGWRSDGIYFFATIRDRTENFERAPTEEMFATWWRFDSVELWIDMQNSKSDDTNKFDCQQFTFWPALTNIRSTPEIYEILWGKKAAKASFRDRKQMMKSDTQNFVASIEHADHRGYDMEIFIPNEKLSNKDYFKGGQVVGFLYIINHGNLVEDSSLEFYKEGYEGYSGHPSSWGNIQFLGTDAKIDQINKENKVIKERVVEVSTNLTLQVTDPDSNQNPNIVDKVTVRVKNENDFDGVKSDNTDWEDVLFTETGKNTGLFTGTITLTVAASKPDDNALCAHAGDVIQAYYNDHIQVAGEYDEKMNIKIKVIAPIQNMYGKNNQ